jgi:hypothetical protein
MSGHPSSRYPDNVSRAVFARELSTGLPGTMVHRMRSMYQVRLEDTLRRSSTSPLTSRIYSYYLFPVLCSK